MAQRVDWYTPLTRANPPLSLGSMFKTAGESRKAGTATNSTTQTACSHYAGLAYWSAGSVGFG